jgi:hypothetical protein
MAHCPMSERFWEVRRQVGGFEEWLALMGRPLDGVFTMNHLRETFEAGYVKGFNKGLGVGRESMD